MMETVTPRGENGVSEKNPPASTPLSELTYELQLRNYRDTGGAVIQGFVVDPPKDDQLEYDTFVSSHLSEDSLGRYAAIATEGIVDVLETNFEGYAPAVVVRFFLFDYNDRSKVPPYLLTRGSLPSALPTTATSTASPSLQPASLVFIDDFTEQHLLYVHLARPSSLPSSAPASSLLLFQAIRRRREAGWTPHVPTVLNPLPSSDTATETDSPATPSPASSAALHCVLILPETREVLVGGSLLSPSGPSLLLTSWTLPPFDSPSPPTLLPLTVPALPGVFPGSAFVLLRTTSSFLLAITDLGSVLCYDFRTPARLPLCILQPPSRTFLHDLCPVGDTRPEGDGSHSVFALARQGGEVTFLQGSVPNAEDAGPLGTDRDSATVRIGRLNVVPRKDAPSLPLDLPTDVLRLALHEGLAGVVYRGARDLELWELGSGRRWGRMTLGSTCEVVSLTVRGSGTFLASFALSRFPEGWQGPVDGETLGRVQVGEQVVLAPSRMMQHGGARPQYLPSETPQETGT